MGKIVDILPLANKEDNLQEIVDAVAELKDALIDVLKEYESESEDEKVDTLTEALDAMEDAYDALNDVLMDED